MIPHALNLNDMSPILNNVLPATMSTIDPISAIGRQVVWIMHTAITWQG